MGAMSWRRNFVLLIHKRVAVFENMSGGPEISDIREDKPTKTEHFDWNSYIEKKLQRTTHDPVAKAPTQEEFVKVVNQLESSAVGLEQFKANFKSAVETLEKARDDLLREMDLMKLKNGTLQDKYEKLLNWVNTKPGVNLLWEAEIQKPPEEAKEDSMMQGANGLPSPNNTLKPPPSGFESGFGQARSVPNPGDQQSLQKGRDEQPLPATLPNLPAARNA